MAEVIACAVPVAVQEAVAFVRRAVARAAGVWSVSRRAMKWTEDDLLIVRDEPGGMREALIYMMRSVLAPGETVEAGGVVIAGDPDALPVAGRRVMMSQPATLRRWAERRAASPRAARHRRKGGHLGRPSLARSGRAAEGQQEDAPEMPEAHRSCRMKGPKMLGIPQR